MANLLEIREMKSLVLSGTDKSEVKISQQQHYFFFSLWNFRNFYFHFSAFPTFNNKNLFLIIEIELI